MTLHHISPIWDSISCVHKKLSLPRWSFPGLLLYYFTQGFVEEGWRQQHSAECKTQCTKESNFSHSAKATDLTTVLLFRTSSEWGSGNIWSTGLNQWPEHFISLLAFTTPETSYQGFKRIKSLNLSNSFSWFPGAAKDGVGLSLANKWFCFIAPHRTTWPNKLRLWALGSLAWLPSSAVWRKG